MNKVIKKISIVLCFVAVVFMGLTKASAALPSSISGINSIETLNYNGYDQLIYKTYSKGVLFCSQFHIQGVGTSCSLSSSQWSMPTQAGVAAIVEKYNASPSKKSYYYAELALNEFLYYYETKDTNNRISSARDVRNTSGVKPFYDAAVKAYNDAKTKFEVTLTAASNKLTFTESGNYYVSNKLTVSGTSNYEVAVSGATGVEVYNKSGNSFYVRVPSTSVVAGKTVTVKVAVKGTKSIKVTKKYNCGNNTQSLVPNMTETTPVNGSDSIEGSITKKQITKLKISKQDITTKKELPGATLVLKDKNGKEIAKWVSKEEPHYIEGLEPGKYFLTETIAPEGYKLSKETIEFTLELDGKVKEVVMYNSFETKLKISKQDITTKKELPGATLVLKDKDGKEIAKWVSKEEPHYIEGLEPGKYFLTETIAPEGYKLSEDTIEFTLKADGKVKEVVMYNAHESKYVVKISKQDITTKEELPGATLIIKDEDGNEVARWVSGEEPHYLELKKGNYILTEIQAPNGYDLSYEVIKFTVGDKGEVETYVVMYNSKTPDTADKNIILIVIAMLGAIGGLGFSAYKLKHQK